MEKKFPQGELLCHQNEKRFKWYVKYPERTTYLPKRKKELAEILALKKYYVYRKQELEGELAVCRAYIHKMQPLEGITEELLVHSEYGRLLSRYFMPMQEELIKWQNAPYEKSDKYKENLIVKGTQGKMLRSKSEAIIDMMLYKNKIPFRYEEDYMDHACDKIKLYCKNGIIPSINLITTYETQRHPLCVEKVESIIQEYL